MQAQESDTAKRPAWPFLVSQGRTVRHRVILAPPFMANNRLSSLLGRAVAQDEERKDVVMSRELKETQFGDLYIVFRVIVARPGFVGEPGEVLTSEGSQPILFREGIVCDSRISVTVAQMQAAHEAAVEAFSTFWKLDDKFAEPIPSTPLPDVGDSPEVIPTPLSSITAPKLPPENMFSARQSLSTTARPEAERSSIPDTAATTTQERLTKSAHSAQETRHGMRTVFFIIFALLIALGVGILIGSII